jgi:hypothetical protein
VAARDIKIGTAMDAVAWARRVILAAATTPPGSPERRRKLDEIALGVARARQAADAYRGRMAAEIRIAVSVVELGLDRLRSRAAPGRDPDVDDAKSAKRRIHPRLRQAADR